MDKITNNILNNIPKNDVKDSKPSHENKVNADILDKNLSSNVVNINDTKKLV